MDDQMNTGQFPQTRVVVLNLQVITPLGSNDPFMGDTYIICVSDIYTMT